MISNRVMRAGALAMGATLAMWIMTAIPASAAPKCFGKAATIVGTSDRDRINGTNGQDVIVGLGGPDLLRGRGGKDFICGGNGSDHLLGNEGNDRLDGGKGGDGIQPGPGDDRIQGGGSQFDDVRYPDATGPIVGSLVTGQVTGMGTDTIQGGVEQLVGGDDDDVLEGDDGFNFLIGLDGSDTLSGLGDFDVLAGGAGDDALDGGADTDFAENYFVDLFMSAAILAGPVTVNLNTGTSTGNGIDTLANVEGASGSLGDDVMTGDAGNNEFTGLLEGDDTADGGPGDDTIDGGEGTDDLDGGPGIDLLGFLQSPTGITIDLGASTDSEGDAISNFENVWGTFEGDSITGDDGPNELLGFGGPDDIFGLGGDDTLIGGGGPDSADGGLGTDTCEAEAVTNCEAGAMATTMSRSYLVHAWKR